MDPLQNHLLHLWISKFYLDVLFAFHKFLNRRFFISVNLPVLEASILDTNSKPRQRAISIYSATVAAYHKDSFFFAGCISLCLE